MCALILAVTQLATGSKCRAGGAQVTTVVLPVLLMHFLLNVAPGSETTTRCHVDLELDALTDRKRLHNTIEDLLGFLPGIWPCTLVKITECSINKKNRRIKGFTTLGYR